MKFLKLTLLLSLASWDQQSVPETMSLDSVKVAAQAHTHNSDTFTDELYDLHFGKGEFKYGHLNLFTEEELTNSKDTRTTKIDSLTWYNLIEPNYQRLNIPALTSCFMFSDQHDLYGYNAFTYQVYEHMEEPAVYFILTDKNNKLVNHMLIQYRADGCGGISGGIETHFENDSTFTSTSDYKEIEVTKDNDLWHREKIISTYKIDPKGQFVLLKSDTARSVE